MRMCTYYTGEEIRRMGRGTGGGTGAGTRDKSICRLTINRQSIIDRNSRSRTLSSVMEIPPTRAYRLFGQKASQSPLLDTVMEVMMNRWQVSEDSVKSGTRAQS